MRFAKLLAFVLLLAILSACGGGGGGSSSSSEEGSEVVTEANSAPTISGTPAITVVRSSYYKFEPVASDADDDNLTYSIENPPSWATFDELTGKIEGTPVESDIATYEDITITVSDGLETASLDAFDISVINTVITKSGQTTSYVTGDDGDTQYGLPLSYTRDNVNEIVTDNNTGLIWQDNADAQNLTHTYSDAIAYCDSLALGGYNDWRLPNTRELFSIVHFGTADPSIDSTFLNINSFEYWTNDISLFDSTYANTIFFDDGTVDADKQTESSYLRCVRGNTLTDISLLRDDQIEVVYDNLTGLVWQDNQEFVAISKSWADAINYCSNLSLAGYTDWRLPSAREIGSIIFYTSSNSAEQNEFSNLIL